MKTNLFSISFLWLETIKCWKYVHLEFLIIDCCSAVLVISFENRLCWNILWAQLVLQLFLHIFTIYDELWILRSDINKNSSIWSKPIKIDHLPWIWVNCKQNDNFLIFEAWWSNPTRLIFYYGNMRLKVFYQQKKNSLKISVNNSHGIIPFININFYQYINCFFGHRVNGLS